MRRNINAKFHWICLASFLLSPLLTRNISQEIRKGSWIFFFPLLCFWWWRCLPSCSPCFHLISRLLSTCKAYKQRKYKIGQHTPRVCILDLMVAGEEEAQRKAVNVVVCGAEAFHDVLWFLWVLRGKEITVTVMLCVLRNITTTNKFSNLFFF